MNEWYSLFSWTDVAPWCYRDWVTYSDWGKTICCIQSTARTPQCLWVEGVLVQRLAHNKGLMQNVMRTLQISIAWIHSYVIKSHLIPTFRWTSLQHIALSIPFALNHLKNWWQFNCLLHYMGNCGSKRLLDVCFSRWNQRLHF